LVFCLRLPAFSDRDKFRFGGTPLTLHIEQRLEELIVALIVIWTWLAAGNRVAWVIMAVIVWVWALLVMAWPVLRHGRRWALSELRDWVDIAWREDTLAGLLVPHSVMIDSQLLDRAYALRDEAKYREAYELFILAANQADNLLEKAGILLNAATNLTQSNEQERSRSLLSQTRVLVAKMNPSALSEAEQDEFIGITVGIEIEEAEVLVAEGKTEAAELSAILERFKDEIKEPKRIDIYDEIQSRRAYCLSDLGFCDRAIPALRRNKKRFAGAPGTSSRCANPVTGF
jgi:hypothetical protein